MMTTLSHQLSFLSRHKLSQVLDQDNIRGCDWRALVEQMGFSYEMVLFLRDKKSPTMALLEEWEMKEGSGATIDLLIGMVEAIDNIPALEVLKNVRAKLSVNPTVPSSPRLSPTFSTSSPYQSPRTSLQHNSPLPIRQSTTSYGVSPPSTKSSLGKDIDPINLSSSVDPPSYSQISCSTDNRSNNSLKQFNQRFDVEESLSSQVSMISISSSISGAGGGRDDQSSYSDDDVIKGRSLSDMDKSLFEGTEFDVFLSFALADMDFAEEMRLRLEHRLGISCYLPSEGLMPGQSFQDEIADKIKRGCRKTVVIMSPDYIDSPWCTYEARLAHHKNPDPRRHVLIPVMYTKCNVPDFISYLYYLDYPRYKGDPDRCERYFWERLYKAIQLPQR